MEANQSTSEQIGPPRALASHVASFDGLLGTPSKTKSFLQNYFSELREVLVGWDEGKDETKDKKTSVLMVFPRDQRDLEVSFGFQSY